MTTFLLTFLGGWSYHQTLAFAGIQPLAAVVSPLQELGPSQLFASYALHVRLARVSWRVLREHGCG